MRKILCFFLVLLLMMSFAVTALAAEFSLDEYAKTDDMAKSWYQGYEPTIKNHVMTLYMPLKAENCIGDITVSLALDDPNVFLLTALPKEVTVSPKDGLYPVKLTLPLEKHRRNGDYPATIAIKGTDSSGKEITEKIAYVIRIRDGYGSHETLMPVIEDVIPDLNVGSDGTLTVTISNPTTTLSATDGMITVTDSTGEILMSGASLFPVPEILPGKSETVQIPMIVLGDAAIRSRVVNIRYSYKVLGSQAELTENYTIPVTQEIRLEQGGVQMPTAIAGELSSMTVPLMNMGKGNLSNVMVKLEIDGVVDAQSVLVGTIGAGETSQAKLTFTPNLNSIGTHSGTVTITCEDVYGNQKVKTLDVTLTVEEPVPEEKLQEEEEKKISKGTIILIVLCVLLAAGIVVQGIILWGKIHKLEEDRL